jgi:Isochorismatase family
MHSTRLRPTTCYEIEFVAFTGFHTNWCVESSARSAYDKGYRVIVISDCTATDTQEEQDYARDADLSEDRDCDDARGVPRRDRGRPSGGKRRRSLAAAVRNQRAIRRGHGG